MSISATAVYYLIGIPSRNHQILKESRVGECLVLKHDVRIVGNLTLTNGGYRVRETQSSSIFSSIYTILGEGSFQYLLLVERSCYAGKWHNFNVEIISWTICTTKILESNRRLFHEDGASRRLLRNQHFNVKIEESSRIPSSREKPAGVASCFRF